MRRKRWTRRVRRYTSCPECTSWSIRVEENGRICRHTMSFGHVERFPPGSRLRPGKLCSGSGLKVLEPVEGRKVK